MLKAAADLFFEQGYAATSIDAIIDRVGGSKRNLYAEFGNKEGLFTALVAQTAAKILSPLAIDALEGRDLRSTLLAFAERMIGLYMSPALIGIYRTAIAESARFPDLMRQFYEQGPERASLTLAGVLSDARARGELRDIDPRTAADLFVAMMRDNVHLQVVLGLRPPQGRREIRAAAEAAVEVFLDGVGASGPR
ncbi:MAG: TetR/AcrR family transcriptional regulator [Pseudomonadota bacterium]